MPFSTYVRDNRYEEFGKNFKINFAQLINQACPPISDKVLGRMTSRARHSKEPLPKVMKNMIKTVDSPKVFYSL